MITALARALLWTSSTSVPNAAVAELLRRDAAVLSLEGVDRFKLKAWSCAKRVDLANLAADDLFDVGDAAGESLVRQRRDLRIRRSYFKTGQLPI